MNVSPSLIAGNTKSYNQKLNVFKTVSGLTKIDVGGAPQKHARENYCGTCANIYWGKENNSVVCIYNFQGKMFNCADTFRF